MLSTNFYVDLISSNSQRLIMNERIFQYLLHYVENPDPRYAVMLRVDGDVENHFLFVIGLINIKRSI